MRLIQGSTFDKYLQSPTAALVGQGLLGFSGGSWGWIVGHIAPEAFVGGTTALVRNGDLITLDRDKRLIELHVSARELTASRDCRPL